jgi:hypothetical protein
VHGTDEPPVVRLPRVRFPGETEYPSQHLFDPPYVVRLPEASINRQGSVGSPLGPIVCIPRRTGTQQASSDRMAETVLLSFFSAVEISSDVPLTQERQQNYPETPTPPLHVSESIVESSLGSDSAISKSIVDVSNTGNAPVHSTHSATTTIPTIASPPPKLPQQTIGRHMCRDWWNGRCYRNPCRFLHPETLPPQTQGYNIVRYSKHFLPCCPDCS